MNRIPADAFTFYFALGPDRSYQAVADKYGVSKTAVANRALEEKWQEEVESMERKAREKVEAQMTESLEEMNLRHLKMLKVIQTKALETLRALPLNSAMAAVRALEAAVKLERTIRGEPAERTAVSMEEIVKRQYDSWMTGAPRGDEWSAEEPRASECSGVPAPAAIDDPVLPTTNETPSIGEEDVHDVEPDLESDDDTDSPEAR